MQQSFDAALAEPTDVALVLRFGVFLASAFTDQGLPAEAMGVLNRVVVHQERIADGFDMAKLEWALSRTYAEAGQPDIAERYARRVVGYFETSEDAALRGRAHLVLAAILLNQGSTTEAEPHLEAAEHWMHSAAGPVPVRRERNVRYPRVLAGYAPVGSAVAN